MERAPGNWVRFPILQTTLDPVLLSSMQNRKAFPIQARGRAETRAGFESIHHGRSSPNIGDGARAAGLLRKSEPAGANQSTQCGGNELKPGEKTSIVLIHRMTGLTRRRISGSRDAAGLLRCLCFMLAVVATTVPYAVAGPSAGNMRLFRFSLARMGTVFSIALYHTDQTSASDAAMAAFERVERLEQILSDYRENSEVRRICRDAAGIARPVSPELFHMLENSLRFSRMTRGAFDVTVGPVVQVWREARRAGREPDAAQLARARESVGYEYVLLDPEKQTVHLLLPRMRLDFGAIAKGYAADEALRVLKSRGIRSALVDAGGDISMGAPPPGEPGWSVAIRNGYEDPGGRGTLSLHDVAVATSGDAYQSLQLKGRRYSHILDPATSTALKDSAAVTVIARDGVTADALATALSVLPVDEGISLIESIPGASALVLRRNGSNLERRASTGFPEVELSRRAVGAAPADRTKN